jgi:hypothetical protein
VAFRSECAFLHSPILNSGTSKLIPSAQSQNFASKSCFFSSFSRVATAFDYQTCVSLLLERRLDLVAFITRLVSKLWQEMDSWMRQENRKMEEKQSRYADDPFENEGDECASTDSVKMEYNIVVPDNNHRVKLSRPGNGSGSNQTNNKITSDAKTGNKTRDAKTGNKTKDAKTKKKSSVANPAASTSK